MEKENKLIEFLNASKNEYFAVQKLTEYLLENKFTMLTENSKWDLKANSNYFVTRNNNSLIAFKTPKKFDEDNYKFKLISAHLDSPCLKIKFNPVVRKENYESLMIEVYGGAILSSFVDRPLALAGRILVRKGNQVVTKLIDSKKAIAIIPNVCIHQNRDINKGFKYNPQIDLVPIVGLNDEKENLFDRYLESSLEDGEEIISYDIYLYLTEKTQYVGIDNSLICGPKLDDLSCAYLGIDSLIESNNSENDFLVTFLADNEETGSLSYTGADSNFLKITLSRISSLCGATDEEHLIALAKSFIISADNGHAIHPNHPELSDSINKCLLNKGLLIKFNSNMKYTSDAFSSSLIKLLCEENNIKYQTFFNRADAISGSTLGNISISQVSILTCDVGLPQLAMHSAYETIAREDISSLSALFDKFYETDFVIDNTNIFINK